MGDIRDNLRTAIRDKGYIQAAIARKSNMSASQLSLVLNKERRLDANELFDLCKAIEMTPSELQNYGAKNATKG